MAEYVAAIPATVPSPTISNNPTFTCRGTNLKDKMIYNVSEDSAFRFFKYAFKRDGNQSKNHRSMHGRKMKRNIVLHGIKIALYIK